MYNTVNKELANETYTILRDVSNEFDNITNKVEGLLQKYYSYADSGGANEVVYEALAIYLTIAELSDALAISSYAAASADHTRTTKAIQKILKKNVKNSIKF